MRRRTTVPVFSSESLPSRMLLLSELKRWPELGLALGADGEPGATQQERLMELLLKAFGNYGSIASVRVLKPGKDLPGDLKKLSGRYSQLGTEECAIVEFEEVEAAMKAHEAVAGDSGPRGTLGLKVLQHLDMDDNMNICIFMCPWTTKPVHFSINKMDRTLFGLE